MAGGAFQGQFGVNDTELSLALSKGDFSAAEEMIRQNTDPSALNDGAYEHFPLHLVLSGNLTRNLRIAKLLVLKGADPNLRIPSVELDSAFPSPFEDLIVYYELLRTFMDGSDSCLQSEVHLYLYEENEKIYYLTDTYDFNGVKHPPETRSCYLLIEEVNELIDVFLRNGADPNIITTFSHMTLFHWIIKHKDIKLASRLLTTCDINLNICDVHGNSPLMDCILRNDTKDTIELYDAITRSLVDVNLDYMNCAGETALFLTSFIGSIELFSKLYNDGASALCKVSISEIPLSSGIEHVLLSPLLAPLLADSFPRLRYAHVTSSTNTIKSKCHNKHYIDKIIFSSISPIVDCEYLVASVVSQEVKCFLIETPFNHLTDENCISSVDLLNLLFGNLNAGLKQLCVRKIYDHTIMYSKTVTNKFSSEEVHILINLLHLPQSFCIFFEVEAAKYYICNLVMGFESLGCTQACSESEESFIEEEEEEINAGGSYSSSGSSYDDSFLNFSSDVDSTEELSGGCSNSDKSESEVDFDEIFQDALEGWNYEGLSSEED